VHFEHLFENWKIGKYLGLIPGHNDDPVTQFQLWSA